MLTTLPDMLLLLLVSASYLLLLVAVYRALQGKGSNSSQIRNLSAAHTAVMATSLLTLYFSDTAITGLLLALALLLLICCVLLMYLDARLKK